jgi:fatty-acyl-CoA synthase
MLSRSRQPIHPEAMIVIVPLNEYDFLKRALVAHSSREAVVCVDTRLTYAQFGQRVNRWANAMRKLGVQKEDRVAMLSQNCHRVLEAFFGTPLLGSILMPLNFRLLPDDFEYILNHGGASVVIVEEGLTDLIDQIRPKLDTVKHFIVASDHPQPPTSEWNDYETLLAKASAEPPPQVDIDENETSALLYTSGTTGRP